MKSVIFWKDPVEIFPSISTYRRACTIPVVKKIGYSGILIGSSPHRVSCLASYSCGKLLRFEIESKKKINSRLAHIVCTQKM